MFDTESHVIAICFPRAAARPWTRDQETQTKSHYSIVAFLQRIPAHGHLSSPTSNFVFVTGVKHNVLERSTSDGPSGKVPYIGIASVGSKPRAGRELIGDSSIVIQTLCRLGRVGNLQQNMSAEGKVTDLSLRRLLEEKWYFMGASQIVHISTLSSLTLRPICFLYICQRSGLTTIIFTGTRFLPPDCGLGE